MPVGQRGITFSDMYVVRGECIAFHDICPLSTHPYIVKGQCVDCSQTPRKCYGAMLSLTNDGGLNKGVVTKLLISRHHITRREHQSIHKISDT